MKRIVSEKKYLRWIGLIAALVIINVVASLLHYRFDLTQEKRYSLTNTTRQLLRELENPIFITVFLKGDYPSGFTKLGNATEDFLRTLRETNSNKIKYRFVSTEEEVGGKSWGDSLQALGAVPINLNVQLKSGQESKLVYPTALINYGEQTALVNIYQGSTRVITAQELNNAEGTMEYQFAKTIDKLVQPQKPLIAYATGNGEPVDYKTYDLQQVVKANYNLFMFDLTRQPAIPDTMKALLIVKPSIGFTDEQKLKIDQYIMRGGKVLWFIDNLNAEQDSLSFKSQLIAYERNLGLQDILFNYGVRINSDLIMDLQCDFMPFAVGGNSSAPQYEFLHWNYYPLFASRNNHLITKNIGLVASRFANSMDTIESNGTQKTFLLQSSSNSRVIQTPALISPNENRNAPEDALFKQHDIPSAVLLEGKFSSFFRNRLSKAKIDSLELYGGFQQKSSGENKMIVVADGDIVLNDINPKEGPLPMGMNSFTLASQYEYQFANRDFLMNCLEYLTSKGNLIETRNKEISLRLLDSRKVEEKRTMWQLINIALPILLIILFGFIYQQMRRRKYAM